MAEDLEDLRDGNRIDIWAPDSDWNSDPNIEPVLVPYNEKLLPLKPNMWIDVKVEYLDDDDPMWGGSRQIISIDEEGIWIRYYNKETDLYEPRVISPELIENVYDRVREVEPA